jgi:hypothetical protein
MASRARLQISIQPRKIPGVSTPLLASALTTVVLTTVLTMAAAQQATGKLRPAQLQNPVMVPLAIQHEIEDQLPPGLAPAGRGVKRETGALRVDSNGDGELDRHISSKSPGVVGQLLLYHKRGTWYAAPAALLQGTVAGHHVQFLDANLDG